MTEVSEGSIDVFVPGGFGSLHTIDNDTQHILGPLLSHGKWSQVLLAVEIPTKKTVNIPTPANHPTITGMHICLIRANYYDQRLGRQKDITDTYLYSVYK